MKLFGSAPKQVQQSPADSIRKLRETLTMLEKREEHLDKKISDEVKNAKQKLKEKNKRGALMCLKRKKAYEGQISKLAGARMTLEQQVMAIEGANINLEALNAMRMGASTMSQIHKNMTVDDVDNTMADIQDQIDVAEEISSAISQPLGGDILDDDELELELEGLEQANLDEQLLQLDSTAAGTPSMKLPSVGTSTPTAAAAEDDDEAQLRALEAEMAL